MTAEIVRLHPAGTSPNPWPRRGVYKVGQFLWLVPSKTFRGDFHSVEWHHNETEGIFYTCSCKAGNRSETHMGSRDDQERPCRHVHEVDRAEKEDGYQLAPGDVGDSGRFVD